MKFEIKNTKQQKQLVNKKVKKGFTLVELLISMTITLIIVGLLMGMTKMAVGAWQKTAAKARSSRIAQEVFDSIGKDLEGIVIRTGNDYEWLLIKESVDMDTEEKGPNSDTEMVNPLEISFFSAVTDRYNGQIGPDSDADKGGDISMIRYRLIHQDLIGGSGDPKPVFALYRERIEPGDDDPGEIDTFNDYLAKTSIDGVKPSDDIVAEKNYLAENIFDFTLSFNFEYSLPSGEKGYYRAVIQSTGDSNSLSIRGNEIYVGTDKLIDIIKRDHSDASSPRLASADVSILVLSDGGMNGLKNTNLELSQYLKENGHHYSKSVILPQP